MSAATMKGQLGLNPTHPVNIPCEEETGVPRENPRLSEKRSLIFFA